MRRPRSTAISIRSPTPSWSIVSNGIALEHARLEVVREEAARVVAGEPERGLGQVVRAEGEEVGVLGDLVGAHARARELDHRPDEVLELALLGRDAHGQLAQPPQLLAEADERVHDLDERRAASARGRRSRRGRSPAPASRRSRGRRARAGTRASRASGSTRAASGSARASARPAPRRARAGTRAAASRAGGSSPAGRPSPRRSPRSRPAGSAAAGRAPQRRPSSSAARIISRISPSRSASANMCSVRQSPMPSAPNSRALAASAGLSAFVRTLSRRIPSAHSRTAEKSSLICGGTSGTEPTITSPVPPSIVIVSPSFSS